MGIGTPPDPTSAFKWFEQAAIQNQAKAQHELGDSYYHGRGVTKDPVMAKKWINKSYINGNKWASESWEKYQQYMGTKVGADMSQEFQTKTPVTPTAPTHTSDSIAPCR